MTTTRAVFLADPLPPGKPLRMAHATGQEQRHAHFTVGAVRVRRIGSLGCRVGGWTHVAVSPHSVPARRPGWPTGSAGKHLGGGRWRLSSVMSPSHLAWAAPPVMAGWAVAAQQALNRTVTISRARMSAWVGYVSASRSRGAGYRNCQRVLSGAPADHERSTDSVVVSETTLRGV